MRIFLRNFASLAIGILFISFTTFASAATRLPPDEVAAFKQIAKTLGKTDWNSIADPCTTFSTDNSVTCNSCNGTVCHITHIALKAQDLQGTLPPELVRLTHLEDIDLSRNYLNGTIPLEWGSMKLVNMHLTSNYFTGELPKELAKLTTLKDFRIGSNNFTGKIPDFIQNWVNLNTRLDMQGSGLDGPIPPGIGLLTKLSDLRISDLNGSQDTFPPLDNLTSLKNLILRSCKISGPLPKYLGTMTSLKLLDLSFNNLSGEIPNNFIDQSKIQMMYLTGNLLSGLVPPWMLATQKNIDIDLSYNNFSLGSSQDCQQRDTNLFGSSSKGNFFENGSCLTLRGA